MLYCSYCRSQTRYNLDCPHAFVSAASAGAKGAGGRGRSQKALLINLSVRQSPQKTLAHTCAHLARLDLHEPSKNTLKKLLAFLSRSSIVSLRIKGGARAARNNTTKESPRCTEEQLPILQCEFQAASQLR